MRLLLALTLLLAGCPGDEVGDPPREDAAAPPVSHSGLLEDSWMFHVAQDPNRLGPFEQGKGGDLWLDFFHNDLLAAWTGFDSLCVPSDKPLPARAADGYACVALARTHLELAEFFATIAAIDRVAQRQFFKHRNDNPQDVLASVHQPYFEGIALIHSGESEAGTALLRTYAAGPDAHATLVALATRIADGLASDPLVARAWGGAPTAAPPEASLGDLPRSDDVAAYLDRLAFVSAIARDDLDGGLGLARSLDDRKADLREELAGGGSLMPPTIHHHDTAYLLARARMHALLATRAVPGGDGTEVLRVQARRVLGRDPGEPGPAPSLADGLALVLFSDAPTPADLHEAQRRGDRADAVLARVGGELTDLGGDPGAELADLDRFVNGSNLVTMALGELLKGAGPSGASLNGDMGLAERFRGRLLVERSRQYQEVFDVRLEGEDGKDLASAGVAAKSLLEMALDKNPSPPNPRLKRARISYRNDPPALAALARAHLDTRHAYDANEFVRPLTEVFTELIATREALASLDSAWNPARKGSVR